MKHTSMLSGFAAVRRPSRAGAHVGLRHLTDGQQSARQLPLAQHVEHVRLVLVASAPRATGSTLRRVDDPRVVAGRDLVEAELLGALEHAPELHRAVALDTRVRRLARRVGVDVRRDHVGIEVVGEVEDVVRDAELRRDATRVLDVGDAAAARSRSRRPRASASRR